MLTKKLADHVVVHSPFCGEIREILLGSDYDKLGIAVAVDIKPTTAHFHKTFDEIYFVLDGELELEFFDPGIRQDVDGVAVPERARGSLERHSPQSP